MTYEVGTHISFKPQPTRPKARRLYPVGARILFIKVLDVSTPQLIAV